MFTVIDPGESNEKDPTFRHGVAASGTRPAVSGLGPRRWLPERLAAWKMLPHGQKGRHGALPLSWPDRQALKAQALDGLKGRLE
ncbi:hypothetical protein [Bordetella bronchiseptica]|uniref:hypothetical protein n=1 Tax=Bordetella bronchiseptica TaxID=518 RepID=UPI00130065F4|nr:hypothetical protein [Bordetella bronchiseptica]